VIGGWFTRSREGTGGFEFGGALGISSKRKFLDSVFPETWSIIDDEQYE